MAFFKRHEKALAATRTFQNLRRNYERTERDLETAAQRGDLQGVKRAMKEHHKFEYALLYKNMTNNQKE